VPSICDDIDINDAKSSISAVRDELSHRSHVTILDEMRADPSRLTILAPSESGFMLLYRVIGITEPCCSASVELAK
jgi:hypothetical protein